MKKLILLGTLILAVLLVFAEAQESGHVEAEIRQLNDQEVNALLRNDTKVLASLWSKDFVVTNPFNKFLNKQQVIGLAETGMIAFSSYDRKIEYVHVYGETAVVAGNETVVWAGKMPNAGKTSRLRFTGIWMQQNGHWLQVARHANIFEPQ